MINKYLIRLVQLLFLAIAIPMAISVMITAMLIFTVGFVVILLMLISAIF